jgi:hypothetical protein
MQQPLYLRLIGKISALLFLVGMHGFAFSQVTILSSYDLPKQASPTPGNAPYANDEALPKLDNTLQFPPNPTENTWYYGGRSDALYIYKGSEWEQIKVPHARMPHNWGKYVMFGTGDMKALATQDGRVFLNPCHWIGMEDSLITGFVCGKGTFVLNQQLDTLAMHPSDLRREFDSDTIQGQRVLCMPGYFKSKRNYARDDLRNWGMLNGLGEWLIAPQYDAPFEFEKGVALVSYKGATMRINEKGEFLKE